MVSHAADDSSAAPPGARFVDLIARFQRRSSARASSSSLGIGRNCTLSRGAARAVFIDDDARALALIAANAGRCGVENRCAIIRGTAVGALADDVGGPFDIVVADPPYDAPWIEDALGAAARHLTADGVLVLEHAWRRAAPEVPSLRLVRTRRAGDSALSTYRPAPAVGAAEGQGSQP